MSSTSFVLALDDFDLIRRWIRARCGIWLGDGKLTFLQSRIGGRLRARNITTAREYYYFLKYDPLGPEEAQALIDAVTVNETWFFRETEPILAWCRTVLPGLLHGRTHLRFWSAGCASGEEPFTLAIILMELSSSFPTLSFDIVGTDISCAALEMAKRGAFGAYSLRHTEARVLNRYFKLHSDGHYEICDALRDVVRFECSNLADPSLSQRMPGVDVILCRNVIIYFDEAIRCTVLNTFAHVLHTDGHLVLGHSESLAHSITPFSAQRVGGAILYRKAGQGAIGAPERSCA